MIPVRKPETDAGYTHASIVTALVTLIEALFGTVTQSLTPSKVSAEPNLPAVVRTGPFNVPVLPLPDPSPASVPDVSSKPHAPTRPGFELGALTVRVTATVFGEPDTPAAPVTVTVAL